MCNILHHTSSKRFSPHVAFEPGLPQSRVQRAPTTAPHCLILVVPKQCVKTGLIVKPCLALILEGLAQVFLVPKAIGKCCSSPCSDQSQPFLLPLPPPPGREEVEQEMSRRRSSQGRWISGWGSPLALLLSIPGL